jgi:hypothetical protein
MNGYLFLISTLLKQKIRCNPGNRGNPRSIMSQCNHKRKKENLCPIRVYLCAISVKTRSQSQKLAQNHRRSAPHHTAFDVEIWHVFQVHTIASHQVLRFNDFRARQQF